MPCLRWLACKQNKFAGFPSETLYERRKSISFTNPGTHYPQSVEPALITVNGLSKLGKSFLLQQLNLVPLDALV